MYDEYRLARLATFCLCRNRSLDKGSASLRRADMEKNVDEMQSELDKLLASTNFLDLGIDLNDPSFLSVRVYFYLHECTNSAVLNWRICSMFS